MPEIKTLNIHELKDIYDKYITQDFPRNERRPFAAMKRGYEHNEYSAYGYFDGESLLAYACFLTASGSPYTLLDYFAVMPDLRNRGIGSAFLKELAPSIDVSEGIFIEAESTDSTKDVEERRTREQRISFYQRNGAVLTGIRCLLFMVDYEVLLLPKNKNDQPKDWLTVVKDFYTAIYRPVTGPLCQVYKPEKLF